MMIISLIQVFNLKMKYQHQQLQHMQLQQMQLQQLQLKPRKTPVNQAANSTISSNFAIEFSYNAINLIKTIKNDNPTQLGIDSKKNYNSFIWKILNQNFNKQKESVAIDLYFDLGKSFINENVEFSLNFTKSLIEENKKLLRVCLQTHSPVAVAIDARRRNEEDLEGTKL